MSRFYALILASLILIIIFNKCIFNLFYIKISGKGKPVFSFSPSPPISNDAITSLASLASLPPPVSPSPTCLPPPLPSVPDCSNQTGLTGELLTIPRNLVLMILFGFEVDTLEIALKEQLDLVTTVFIVESTRTHRGVSTDDYKCLILRTNL